jgi:lipopolysaccharide transport system permease protein
MNINEEWDTIITPKNKWFNLNFYEIWNYRDLLMMFVKRDIVSFYKQTILGPLWYFIQPIFTTIVFTFVFGNLANIDTNGIPKPLFYLIGIISWNYFADCLLKTSTIFKDNQAIFGKVYFPRVISPLSLIFSNLVKFFIQLILLFILIVYYELNGFEFIFTWKILLLPIYILLMAMQGIGLGMAITAMTNKYKDLSILVPFGVQLMMYGTTIIYPLSVLSGNMKKIVTLNPMTYIIEGVKYSIFNIGNITLYNLLYSFAISLLIFLMGFVIFNKVEKNFVDTI